MTASTHAETVSFEKRKICETMWINSLLALHKEVSDPLKPMVINGIDFLYSSVKPAEPVVSDDGGQPGIRRANNKVGFVTLFHADAQLHPFFKGWIDHARYSYTEDTTSIMVPPHRLTPRWRGILMLHELLHAQYHKENVFRDRVDPHYAEEQSIYTDELKIVEDIYGEPYAQFIANEAPKLLEEIEDGRIPRKALAKVANRGLETVLNDTQYEHEFNLRRGATIMHLGYEALALLNISADETRAQFTRSVERDAGSTVWLGSTGSEINQAA